MAGCSLNILAIPICFVLELQEQQSIMHQQANTELDSSLGKILCVHVANTLSKQDAIFYMTAKGSTTTGIQEGIPLHTSFFSQNLMVMHSPYYLVKFCLRYSNLYSSSYFVQCFSLFFSSLSLSLFPFMQFTSIVSSYKVATTVCLHAPCNKLLT